MGFDLGSVGAVWVSTVRHRKTSISYLLIISQRKDCSEEPLCLCLDSLCLITRKKCLIWVNRLLRLVYTCIEWMPWIAKLIDNILIYQKTQRNGLFRRTGAELGSGMVERGSIRPMTGPAIRKPLASIGKHWPMRYGTRPQGSATGGLQLSGATEVPQKRQTNRKSDRRATQRQMIWKYNLWMWALMTIGCVGDNRESNVRHKSYALLHLHKNCCQRWGYSVPPSDHQSCHTTHTIDRNVQKINWQLKPY